MLDLFRAVVPVFHANEIDNVPQLSMLFVNDCHYIAHHLMTLGFQFQVRDGAKKKIFFFFFFGNIHWAFCRDSCLHH